MLLDIILIIFLTVFGLIILSVAAIVLGIALFVFMIYQIFKELKDGWERIIIRYGR